MPPDDEPARVTPAAYERLLESIPGALLVVDAEGVIRYATGQLERFAGRTAGDAVGGALDEYVDEADRPMLRALLATISLRPPGELVGPVRMPYLHENGTKRLAEAWAVNRTEDPDIAGLVVLLLLESSYDHFDQVLAAVMAGASLADSLSALASALSHPPVGGDCFFIVPSTDGRDVSRFPALPEVPGPPMPGPWVDVWEEVTPVGHVDLAGLPEETRMAAAAQGLRAVFCFHVRPPVDGHPGACLVVWTRSPGHLPLNAQIAVDRALVLASLVISHSTTEERLREAAYSDPLTGLANRASFFDALGEMVEAGDQPAILYIDLDGFKEINDRLGHLAGDSVLRVLARRLASVVRPNDELARIGGDEFAILCAGEIDEEQISAIARRVIERLDEPLTIGDAAPVVVGGSVGVALGLPAGTSPNDLVAKADSALYAAKAAGGSAWRVADR